MRSLVRLLFSDPTTLFTTVTVAVALVAVLAFVLFERRARAMAELSDDPDLAAGQRRRLAIVGVVAAGIVALTAWASFFRVTTAPTAVLLSVTVRDADGHAGYDLGGDRGAERVRAELAAKLDGVGLELVALDDKARAPLDGVGEAPDDATLREVALAAHARWLIRIELVPAQELASEFGDESSFVFEVGATIVDAESGEAFVLFAEPLRVFAWGEDASRAAAIRAEHLAERVAMPLLATLAEREPLKALTGDRTQMTADEAVRAVAIEPLFTRADAYARGVADRVGDEASTAEREPTEHTAGTHRRLGGVLDEEYWLGSAADGRSILLTDPKHVVVTDARRYALTSEAEALVLADRDGGDRTVLLERYNFYSAPEVSADGRVLWTTVADPRSRKTLATVDVETGAFTPVLSHPTHYFTSPLPAPDGARALFYSRPGRYAETAIELIGRDGSDRRVLIGADELGGVPVWSHDGTEVYAPIGSWQRIVAIDVATGVRRHLLGQDPNAAPEPDPEADPEADPETDPDPGSEAGPTPDPRHGPSLTHHGGRGPADGAPEPDPATRSRFTAVSLDYTGRALYVVEQSLDGRKWLGRLDLDALAQPTPDPDPEQGEPNELDPDAEPPAPAYTRLAGIPVGRLLASPTAPVVAFEAPEFTAAGDPETRDQEILVYGPEPGQLRAITLNDTDDELAGWSRDGKSLYTFQRDRDPASDRHPVTRVYRHDL